MKPIKIFTTLLFFFSTFYVFGQTYAFDINDYVVAGSKTAIIAGLASEIVLKNEQNDLLDELTKLEKEINEKKSVLNINSLILVSTSIYMLQDTESEIDDLKKAINVLKLNPLSLKHGLRRSLENLDTEKKYLDECNSDYYRYLASGILSGGEGQVYTVFSNFLIRVLKIRSTVLSIKKDIKSLSVINKLFIK